MSDSGRPAVALPGEVDGRRTGRQVRIDRRGVHADRLWAVRDVEKGVTASARRLPALLGCSARYADRAGRRRRTRQRARRRHHASRRRASCPATIPPSNDALSELVGPRGATDGAAAARRHEPAPDDDAADSLANFSAGAGAQGLRARRHRGAARHVGVLDQGHHHAGPLLHAARHVRRPQPGAPAEHRQPARRWLPTAPRTTCAGSGPTCSSTSTDAGARVPGVGLGGRRRCASARPCCDVTIPTIRCVVPTRPQPGIELDRGITRQLAERTNRFLGVYADVGDAGRGARR